MDDTPERSHMRNLSLNHSNIHNHNISHNHNHNHNQSRNRNRNNNNNDNKNDKNSHTRNYPQLRDSDHDPALRKHTFKVSKRQPINKKTTRKKKKHDESICLKCCITGKNCKCVKKKSKVAKYLLQDCIEIEQLKQRKALDNAHLNLAHTLSLNKNVSPNSKSSSNADTYVDSNTLPRTPSLKSDPSAESKIINMEHEILSEILDFYLKTSTDPTQESPLPPKLPDLPDLSTFYDPNDSQITKDIALSSKNFPIRRSDISAEFWTKAGFTAPNVVKPTLNNILSNSTPNEIDTKLFNFETIAHTFYKDKFFVFSKDDVDACEPNSRAWKMLSYLKLKLSKDEFFKMTYALMFISSSYISQRMHTSDQDIVRIEMSRKRVLTEFERLLEFTATPVASWRPTGEISMVSREFTLLTWWKKEDLLSSSRMIFELMNNSSIVSYWENFAVCSFQNINHAPLLQCTLLRPDKSVIKCAFSFSIKRDLFGTPMEIIGSFLPVVS